MMPMQNNLAQRVGSLSGAGPVNTVVRAPGQFSASPGMGMGTPMAPRNNVMMANGGQPMQAQLPQGQPLAMQPPMQGQPMQGPPMQAQPNMMLPQNNLRARLGMI